MSDPKKPDDREPVHSIAAATLVNGILDGTYTNLENAQIALERSRLSKRKSNLGWETARSGEGGDHHPRLIDVLQELDDEISQLIPDTSVTPIPAFDHGISRSTADIKAALMQW
ncbi:hypothetical protein SAMN05444161_8840 [Rhizobiales bacterium GAS191]|nr:hypothetical protein SAMN05444161_8840 [Rhizobiales bacterium GAS191]